MRNSKKQRDTASKHCQEMNARSTNPFRDPAKQRELSMRVWNNPEKKARILKKRKSKPGFKGESFVWAGKTKTEEQKVKYREFSKAKEELAREVSKLGLEINIRSMNKEQTIKTLAHIKKLPR